MSARIIGVALWVCVLECGKFAWAADPGSGFPAPAVYATASSTPPAPVSTPSGNMIVEQTEGSWRATT